MVFFGNFNMVLQERQFLSFFRGIANSLCNGVQPNKGMGIPIPFQKSIPHIEGALSVEFISLTSTFQFHHKDGQN